MITDNKLLKVFVFKGYDTISKSLFVMLWLYTQKVQRYTKVKEM